MNEEKSLPTTLQSVLAQKPSPQEIVVVDPGSTDRTSEVASECGAQVLTSPRGRAVQMNAGARNTKADVLLFLHADTGLPEGAVAAIQVALCNPRVLGGCFELRFHEEEESWTLQLWSWCTRVQCCRTKRLVFGDRGIFVRRSSFEELGGYSEWPILEDVDFVMRLARLGSQSFEFLPLAVTTSARRMLEKGPLRQQLLNSCIIIAWYLGASPEQLRDWYRYQIAP
ncbi:6-GlcNAc synthase) (Biofilm PGA synthesis protein PgaC) (N-acetylglucosaminyltransferase PgaC) [Durusdinium trenchii]